MLTFDSYQDSAAATAVYPQVGKNIAYPALGLGGEAGEVQNKVKKVLRDDGGVLTPDKRDAIADEIGDVLWYAAVLAREIGASLEDIALRNIEKLKRRAASGTLQGSGDKR